MAAVQQAKTDSRTSQVRFDGFISYSHTADELLAPRLQAALQTFAKPWWKRRALRVFRDQSSLSANPHLWSSITAALDASDWFILLTSPEAAASSWVDREVAYWREQKDPEKIIPVLTEGTLAWDEASGRLDPHSSVPPSLLDAYNGEPRWVDLRWAEEETQLDLRNGRFREAVADIASSLRAIPKDDLESEEVRQHRHTRRTAWGAGIALAVLAVAAVTGAVMAVDQRDQAEAQRVLAEGETIRAESAESLARSRELAASAINLLDDNPELSILLGLEAIESTPSGAEQPVEAINALREATHASRLRSREAASPLGGFVAVDLSSDGTRLATVAYLEGKVTVTDVASGREISSYTDSTTVDHFFAPSFSADGTLLAVGVADSSRNRFTLGLPIIPRQGSETPDDLGPRVVVLRAETGEVVRTIDYPSCSEALPRPRFSPDGAWLAVAGLYGADCRDDQLAVELLDADTLQLVHRWETTADQAPSWTADGSRLAVGSLGSAISGTVVFDVATREAVLQHPGDFGILSPDGQLLIVEVGLGSLDVIEVATGTRVDILTGFGGIVLNRAFTADSSRLIVGTGERESLVFDLESGKLVHRLSPTGVPISFACAARCETLYQSNLDGEVLTWDLSTTAGGEINTVDTGYFVNADSVATAGDIGVFLGFSFLDARSSDVVRFDRASGQISTDRRPTGTNKPMPLPDGRIVLLEVSESTGAFGPVVAWDPSTGNVEEVAGCWTTLEAVEESGFGFAAIPCVDREGDYFLLEGAFLSPDQSSLLIADPLGNVKRFDARTLAEQTMPSLPTATVQAYGGTWLLSYDGEDANVVDLSDGRVVATLQGGSSHIARTDVSANGESVALFNIDSLELTVYDTGTWQPITSFFPGATRGISFSADGSKILTAQNDGYVRIWDVRAGTELFRIPLPSASDGYWLDETHVVVGASTGLWTTITLDLDELKDLASARLTRGFTAEECETYRIDPCPDLPTITSR